jgi:5'-3' exonuclease
MVMLIDYSSLLFRTFHTIPATVPMNAVYGFLNMLARLLVDRRPDRLAVAVDDDWRPDFRVDAIPSYKAHRVSDSDEPDPIEPQEALGRDVLRALGIAVVGAAGFEAEDVIATLARPRGGSTSYRATATSSRSCATPTSASSTPSPA